MIELRRIACLVTLALGPSVALAQSPPATTISGLRFIGAITVPNDAKVDGMLVGGLSSIDYDGKTGLWTMISDDKSDNAPARFYVGKLTYGTDAFTAVDLTHAVPFLQADGSFYPNARQGGEVPDPEALRLDPVSGNVWWTSEGDRRLGLSPFVRVAAQDGKEVAKLPTPEAFQVHKDQELGSRHNLSFEGIAFAPDAKSVWVAMETALYQDGPIATVDAGAVARFIHMDRDGKVLGEVAYPVDPIPAKPAGKNSDNGVSELLDIDDHRFLVLERSGVEGVAGIWKSYIRVYEIDVTGATDVSGFATLKGATYQPVEKRLILDLSKAPEIGHVDNLEGISFGPMLANGHRSLVLVSDNNFNPLQVTQFLAFDVLP